jgi:hypothetical protein
LSKSQEFSWGTCALGLALDETQSWLIDWTAPDPQPPVLSDSAYLHLKCGISYWK